jgi:hypothetical protein
MQPFLFPKPYNLFRMNRNRESSFALLVSHNKVGSLRCKNVFAFVINFALSR